MRSLGPPEFCTPSPVPVCPHTLSTALLSARRLCGRARAWLSGPPPKKNMYAQSHPCAFSLRTQTQCSPTFLSTQTRSPQEASLLWLCTHECPAHGHTCAPHLATRTHRCRLPPLPPPPWLALRPADLGQAGRLEAWSLFPAAPSVRCQVPGAGAVHGPDPSPPPPVPPAGSNNYAAPGSFPPPPTPRPHLCTFHPDHTRPGRRRSLPPPARSLAWVGGGPGVGPARPRGMGVRGQCQCGIQRKGAPPLSPWRRPARVQGRGCTGAGLGCSGVQGFVNEPPTAGLIPVPTRQAAIALCAPATNSNLACARRLF